MGTMYIAITVDGLQVHIDDMEERGTSDGLYCPGMVTSTGRCAVPVWAKALHSKVVGAHFAGSHKPGCDKGVFSPESLPGDAGHFDPSKEVKNELWEIPLEVEKPTSVLEARHDVEPGVVGDRTRRMIASGSQKGYAAGRRALSTLLKRVSDVKVGSSNVSIKFGSSGREIPFEEISIRASDGNAEAAFTDRKSIFWGRVIEVRNTQYGGLMIKGSEEASALAVLLKSKDLEDLRLSVSDAEKLKGRGFMAIGKLVRPENNGRSYIIPTDDLIAFKPAIRRIDRP